MSWSETETNKNRQLCGEKKIAGTVSVELTEANALSSAWRDNTRRVSTNQVQPVITSLQTLNYQHLPDQRNKIHNILTIIPLIYIGI